MTEFAITIEGMHCGACVRRVKTALDQTPGVTELVVEVGRARGQLDGAVLADVVAAVTRAGYAAHSE
ncbi:MAG: heavy-metal-associated domain-containing protein [Myxococcales bacterium]|nr:heavy-metal-associated domain-containing protein [Myxococcales bacterium]